MTVNKDNKITRKIDGYTSVAISHTGNVRKANEDSVLALPAKGVWIVADGMGGHEAGDVASKWLVENVESIEETCSSLSGLVNRVEDAVLAVHDKIRDYSQQEFDGKTMGSTLVSLLVKGSVGICLWAGDSRLYRLRDGVLSMVSVDHSQINEMISKGILTPEEAKGHPSSNVITRAVGANKKLFLDVTLVDILPDDRFLLCSDGLYGEMKDNEICKQISLSAPIEKCAKNLVETVLAGKAKDNLSVVLIQAKGSESMP